jgi:putative ABC transport system permease protein
MVQGIETLAPIFFRSTNLYPNKTKPLNIFLCGFTPEGNKRLNAYRLVAGEDLPPGDMRAILLNSNLARKHHIRLGDYVFLKKPAIKSVSAKCMGSAGNGPPDQTASVQWGKFKVVGFIAPEHLGAKNNSRVGIIPFYAGVEFFKSLFPFFWAQTADGYPQDKLKAELGGMVRVSKPSFAIIGESSMERAFRNGVHICAFFALGLGLFVVFSSFSMSLLERIKQIGLLRLVGATSSQISLMFLTEATIMALIASILGLIFGLGLTAVLIKFRITTLGLGKPVFSFHVPWGQVMVIMVLGIIMDYWGALYPMLKARRISPISSLNPRENDANSKTHKTSKVSVLVLFIVCLSALYFFISPFITAGKQARIFILSGLGSVAVFSIFLLLIPTFSKYSIRAAYFTLAPYLKIEGKLAMKNIENSPSRIRFSVCALMLVVAGALALNSMINSMDREIDDWADVAMQDRVYLFSSRKIPPSELDPIRGLPMVQALIPMSSTVTTPYFIKGVDPTEMVKFGPFAKDPDSPVYKEFSQADSLIVSKQFARIYKLGPGDKLTLSTSEGKKDSRVLAVMDDYGFFPYQRAYALMDEANFTRYFCISGDEADMFNIKLKTEDSFRKFRRGIRHKIKWPANFYTMADDFIISMATAREINIVFHENIRPNFIIFDVILYIIVILIGIGTLNSLLISALARKKEIGLMRVVGMTADQISRTLLIEGGMIGLVSGILGVLMGLILSAIAINGLAVVSGLELSYPLHLRWIIISFVGAIVVAISAGIYPAKKTQQFSVIEAIQYE